MLRGLDAECICATFRRHTRVEVWDTAISLTPCSALCAMPVHCANYHEVCWEEEIRLRHIRDRSLPGRGVGSCARLRQGSWCGWETSSTSLPASLSQPRPIPPNPVSQQALARSASPRDTSSCRSLLRDGWYTTYAGRQLCLSPLHTSTTTSQVLSGYPTKLLLFTTILTRVTR